MLSDGCLCMSAFVFGAGFQADPIRVLLWLHMVEHLQQHTKHRKRLREKGRISVGFLISHLKTTAPKLILTQSCWQKENYSLFLSINKTLQHCFESGEW